VNELPAATERVAQRLTDAIESGDPNAIAACCTDNVVVWHNYDNLEVGFDVVVPMLSTLVARVPGVRYVDVRRYPIERGYVQQHVVRGDAPSGRLNLPACMIVDVRDGLIARIEEYLDRAAISVLRQPRQIRDRAP